MRARRGNKGGTGDRSGIELGSSPKSVRRHSRRADRRQFRTVRSLDSHPGEVRHHLHDEGRDGHAAIGAQQIYGVSNRVQGFTALPSMELDLRNAWVEG